MLLADKARMLSKEAAYNKWEVQNIGATFMSRFRKKAPRMNGVDRYAAAKALSKKLSTDAHKKGMRKGLIRGGLAGTAAGVAGAGYVAHTKSKNKDLAHARELTAKDSANADNMTAMAKYYSVSKA